jgi:hypothetical protein
VSRAAALACILALLAAPAGARELWSQGDASLELAGSARELLVGTHGTSESDFEKLFVLDRSACLPVASFPDCAAWGALGESGVVTSLTRLRLQVDLRATSHLSAEVVLDNEVSAGSLGSFEAQIGDELATGRLAQADWLVASGRDAEWRQLLYRAYVRWESPHLEITLGRQRIPWGVGRLWNPIDRLNPIGPLALEADQSQGVDAVRARWLFSGFTYLEAVYAAGRRGPDRSYALRLHGVVHDVDYSLLGGVFEQAPTAGLDLATNLGGAAGRVEAVFTSPQRKLRPFGSPRAGRLPDYWQVVLSLDYSFDVGSGLYALVEHLYNGNALGFGRGRADGFQGFFQEADAPVAGRLTRVVAPGSPDLFGQSRVVSLSHHLTGGLLGYDLTPELRAEALAIYDWEGASASFFPRLVWSPLAWLELTAGAQLFTGPRRSEFGGLEPLGFLLAEVFF